LIINIANLKTIKSFLHEEFLKQKDADVCIRISACIELMDILEPNENGYQIKYDKELEVSVAPKKLKNNSIRF
jgi:glutamate racemase